MTDQNLITTASTTLSEQQSPEVKPLQLLRLTAKKKKDFLKK
jgi:hypothetical protein